MKNEKTEKWGVCVFVSERESIYVCVQGVYLRMWGCDGCPIAKKKKNK